MKPKNSGVISMQLTIILLTMVFLFWLLFTSQVIRIALRNSPSFLSSIPAFGVKMAAYSAQKKTPDIVFIGSSRIHRQVDVLSLGQKLSKLGCTERTIFNLGVGGSSASNTSLMLNWLNARKNTPQRIWVEPWGAEQWLTINSARSLMFSTTWPLPFWQRSMHYKVYKEIRSDLFARYMKFKSLFKDTSKSTAHNIQPIDEWLVQNRTKRLSSILASYKLTKSALRSYLSVGMIHIIFKSQSSNELTLSDYQEVGVQGFRPLDEWLKANDARRISMRQKLKNEPDFFANALARRANKYSKVTPQEAQRMVLEDASLILKDLSNTQLKRLGIIYPPMTKYSNLPVKFLEYKGIQIPVLTARFEDIPGLANATHWIDIGHLSRSGAKMYSENLAKQMCDK